MLMDNKMGLRNMHLHNQLIWNMCFLPAW